ncbi:MAG: helix-turn-helix transcriptional regulator [Lachnospiraceae bacterium]|nr:helix-turn-helix transcriptional regulator [Lachnospiraceae bacterium]
MQQYPTIFEEQTAHGHAIFPCAVYQIDSIPEHTEKIYCHWHHELELLLIHEGTSFLHIDNQIHSISTGDVAFIPSNAVHMVIGESNSVFRFTAVVFHPDFIKSFGNDAVMEKYLNPLFKWQFACPYVLQNSPACQKLILHIASLYQEKKSGYELFIKMNLLEICALFYHYAEPFQIHKPKCNDYQTELAKKMMLYLQQHYDEKITLSEMATHFHISKGHLCRFFKEMTNMSPFDYLNYFRITKSTRLLHDTNLSISTIAGQTGFNNISYYNRTFRKYMHMTPGAYRKDVMVSPNEKDEKN